MSYQLIAINKERRDIAELEREIAEYEELYSEGTNTLEARKKKEWIERRAYELGYAYEGDIIIS